MFAFSREIACPAAQKSPSLQLLSLASLLSREDTTIECSIDYSRGIMTVHACGIANKRPFLPP